MTVECCQNSNFQVWQLCCVTMQYTYLLSIHLNGAGLLISFMDKFRTSKESPHPSL